MLASLAFSSSENNPLPISLSTLLFKAFVITLFSTGFALVVESALSTVVTALILPALITLPFDNVRVKLLFSSTLDATTEIPISPFAPSITLNEIDCAGSWVVKVNL